MLHAAPSILTKIRTNPSRRALLAGMFFSLLLPATALCQATPDQTPAPVANPDGQVTPGVPTKPKTRAELTGEAWDLLTNALNDDKHPEIRIQGLAALGTMGVNPRSSKLIEKSFSDKDVDVRTAAILAAGQTRDRNLFTGIRILLDDKEPQVVFTAATTLWKMGDRSGEDILMAVVDGDRKTNAKLVGGTMHSMNKELHDPAALAKLGAMQGASMLLGPFGYGITAYEYIHKNGGDSARVTAIEQISENHTQPIRKEMLSALTDKDMLVRVAACKALRTYHDSDVANAIAALFTDSKRPVQFNAAASYLISSGSVAVPRPVTHTTIY
ncbi:HEAT repeat-containing protein [Granulicella rosea]|uniref:HEAT repeat-containing protein n=1 Tax=Granulicella rosea TaxID=474952 RepID=A0A239MAP2_9BACT|nr:HEAT repeat domain-containing protein [Granulicella rosea]SNT40047.1 HEAT repeat-containing protein [Granulicella rosea]